MEVILQLSQQFFLKLIPPGLSIHCKLQRIRHLPQICMPITQILTRISFEDILLPFQIVNDSVTIGIKRWISGSEFVVEEKKELNPKRNSIRILENSVSGIKAKELSIITPDDYELKQNYPNPFNPETNIEFFLPLRKKISLTIYNAIGQKVTSLISDQQYDSGSHKLSWDGTNQAGVRVASGVYIYTLKYGNFTKSKRMTLLK